MPRPSNIYSTKPSIIVNGGSDMFSSYQSAAEFALTGLGSGERGRNINPDTAKFIVNNRAEIIRILSFPAPRKTRVAKAKAESTVK